jgi:LysM repeat protein
MVRFPQMSKNNLIKILIIQIALVILSPLVVVSASTNPQPAQAPPFSASDVIAAINSYRTQNGLPALTTNALLNSLAQTQANYQASIDYVTHTGPDGSSPQDRAIAAGYGDGEGFYFSEIIYGGYNATADDAMTWWKNSSTHNYYILQATYVEIGAAIATSGSTTYFTAELAGSYSGSTSSTTGESGNSSSTSSESSVLPTPGNIVIPVQKSTPNADGSIIHTVQEGQTLWTLAAVYEVELNTLLEINGFTTNTYVFPGDEILIQSPGTAPTAGPTNELNDGTITPDDTTTANQKILGTPIAYGGNPEYTNTPIIIKVPTKTAQSEIEAPPQNTNIFSENKTIRIIVIIALICLVIVIAGSIFLQTPPPK